MKKTDLEKNKALKLLGKMKQDTASSRYATDAGAAVVDKREQRRLDQAQGLISFPIKIKQTLADEIRSRATAENRSVNDVAGDLLEKALKA